MAVSPSPTVVFVALFATFCFAVFQYSKKTLPAPYPPGPPCKPIFGNAFDIPLEKSWLKFSEWAKQFDSDIIHLRMINTHILVLQTVQACVDLLEKRSANYSSRMSSPILEMVGMEDITPFLPYGHDWRKHRRFLEGLKKDHMLSYRPVYEEKVCLFLDQLVQHPTEFKEHCKTLGTSTTMAIAFGYDLIPDRKDEYIELAEFAIDTTLDLLMPGRSIIQVFPFLKHIPPWFPGASVQRLCATLKKASVQYKNQPFKYVKKNMAMGSSKPCVLEKLLQRHSNSDGSCEAEAEKLMKSAMAGLYLGGVESMQAIQNIFILAMTVYPDVQKRAQEEIARVVGSDRLPTFDDRPSLPYIEAIYREVLRWRPIAPLGFAHATVDDDIYKGFYIPKGAVVFTSFWAITRGEKRYPEPEIFRPERFFKADGTLNDDTVDYMFGFGRRICPGRHMADLVQWLMMASVLATFNISKAKDENGNEIDVDPNAFSNSISSHPLPFKCSIVPHSQQARSLIRDAATAARQSLKVL